METHHKDSNPIGVGSSLVTFEDVPSPMYSSHIAVAHSCHMPLKRAAIENTYRIEPTRKFPATRVEELIRKTLVSTLTDKVYDAGESCHLVKVLSTDIKKRVLELKPLRYKIITTVTIGQKSGQRFLSSSRFVWDTSKDTFASASFENKTMFAVGCVYGTYYE